MKKTNIIGFLLLAIIIFSTNTFAAELPNTRVDYTPYMELNQRQIGGAIYKIQLTNLGDQKRTYEITPDINMVREIGSYRIDPSYKLTISPGQSQIAYFFLSAEKEVNGRKSIPITITSGAASTTINLVARTTSIIPAESTQNPLGGIIKLAFAILLMILIVIIIIILLSRTRKRKIRMTQRLKLITRGNKMKKSSFNILILTIIVAIIAITSASNAHAEMIINKVSDDFCVTSPYPIDNVKECGCGVRADIVEVTNKGDFKTNYKVDVSSPIRDLITLSDDSFCLQPGEKKKVYVYVNAPSNITLDTDYLVTVNTDFGRSKEVYKRFVTEKCQNIKFVSKLIAPENITPGDIVTTQVEIQNVGGCTDTFKLIPDKYQNCITLSENEITLGSMESKKVYMYFKCGFDVCGQIDEPFTVLSLKNSNAKSGRENFYINCDYDFTIKPQSMEIEACEDTTTKVGVQIQNLAETPNKYYIQLDGPEFVKLSQDTLTLGAKDSGNIALIINPSDKEIGDYEATIRVQTEYGKLTKQKTIKLKINDCYNSKASINGSLAIRDRDCFGKKAYYINLRNDGQFEEAYEVLVDSPGWAKIDEENRFVRLKPTQQVNIPVEVTRPCCDDENQTSYVLIKQLRAPYQAHEIRLDMESLGKQSCYNIDLLQDRYAINHDTKSISLILKNTGLRGGDYSVELADESKMLNLGEDELSFIPGEEKTVHLYPKDLNGWKEGTYLDRINLKLTPKEYSETREVGTCAEPNAKKTIAGCDKVEYYKQFWIVLKDKSFLTKIMDYLRSFNYSRIGVCGAFSLILLALLMLLVITVAYLKSKKEFKIKRMKSKTVKTIKVINIVLIVLLVLALLALVLVGMPKDKYLYEEGTNSTSPLFHEWKQNTEYQINIDNYFTDPDQDSMKYTSTQPNHILVKINGNLATLNPEHGWSGTEYIVFTANDLHGGITDSKVMTLHIIKKRPLSIMDYWNLYCMQINLAILMLIIAFMLILLDFVEEKGFNHYYKRK